MARSSTSYKSTPNLADAFTHTVIMDGGVRLQRGQWILCAGARRKSRITRDCSQGLTLWAVHPQMDHSRRGPDVAQNSLFLGICRDLRPKQFDLFA
jgi:hypothetical protein